MISRSKDKCTKCGVDLDNGNRYVSSDSRRYNKCIQCKRLQLNEYAKQRAKRKKEAGKWFFESGQIRK